VYKRQVLCSISRRQGYVSCIQRRYSDSGDFLRVPKRHLCIDAHQSTFTHLVI